ncbi:MAG: ABC transporter ATP-binding protein [Epsilonproteobacteria bacterium]|nr:ABC transporter ATP-binding protein [Campylobacterota bacterium]
MVLMKAGSRLLGYTRAYTRPLITSLLCAALYGIFSATPPYLLKKTIDEVFIARYSNLIIPLVGLFVLFFALKGLFAYLTCYYMHFVNNRVINDIRDDLYKKVIHFPISFFQKNNTGKLMSCFLNDAQMIQQSAASAIKDGIRGVFEALFLICFALYQNITLGILLLLIAPVLGFAIRRLGKMRKSASIAIQQQMGSISSLLQETFTGIREIKSFNAEAEEIKRFDQHQQACFSAIMHNVQLESMAPPLIELIAIAGCSFVFYVAIHQVLSGTITAGQLSSFVAAVVLSYQPLKKIMNVYSDMQYGLAAAEKIFEVIDLYYPTEHNRPATMDTFSSTIAWEHVSASYDGKHIITKDVCLAIRKGERIGIVGPSGGGKSTFCDMLLGFISPAAGKLYLDGVDITTLSLASLRKHIGYVSQRTFLFNDTITRNIAYARPDATQEQIVAACKAAHAHEFIQTLPNGYQTIAGENGTLLSGGQKQRLTIARALLKNPDIMIFDEATSSLDDESERMIKLAINELPKEKTVLIVSHRMSMLDNVDRILLVNNKTITELDPTSISQQSFSLGEFTG